ncbi:MAG: hypothetical protein Q7P63_01960 [Verrucomicrobiota bacterium JB022]|nr:hypothetical protein [Verrucomicrobiota bacterium JB022]
MKLVCSPLVRALRVHTLPTTLGLLLAGPMLALQAQENDDLLAYEGFEYDVGSSIEMLSGGSGWNGGWGWRVDITGGNSSQVRNSAIVQSGSLSYGGLTTKGNHVHLTGANGELQLARRFAAALGAEPNTSTYVSFIGQRVGPLDDPEDNPSTPDPDDFDSWYPNPYPRGASVRLWSGTSERISVGNFSNWKTNKWSVYGSSLDTVSDVDFSEQAFIVVRIDHVGDATVADNLYIWVNPDLSMGESLANADITKVAIMDGEKPIDFTNLNWISPFVGNASTTGTGALQRPHAEMLLDELRVGRTWASVTPESNNWALNFGVDAEGNTWTGDFLRTLYVSENNWLWAYRTNSWIYLPADWVTSEGSWVYFYDTNANPPQSADVTWAGFPRVEDYVWTGNFLGTIYLDPGSDWVWSFEFENWVYLPEERVTGEFALGYVENNNTDEVPMPSAAISPSPANEDGHVDAEDGSVLLSWRRGQGAETSTVYFGTDPEAVANATPESPEYLGSVTEAEMEVERAFNPLQTYYWRVDSTNAAGTATGDVWEFAPRRLAFPGAEGYGRFAVGGRNGQVVTVTNLNDSGEGSLRWAIEEVEGPRTVVFNVAGTITLESNLTVQDNDDQITIAGQTAPGKGITIRKHKLGFSGVEDGIMRYMRIRLGNTAEQTSDGTGMQGSNHSIYDHVSVSWSIDEAFSSRSGRNITLQRTILAEALNEAGHKNYPEGAQHGYAASIGGDVGSFHHNLLVHCAGRNWSMAGGLDTTGAYAGRLDLRNNIVYNWRSRATDGGAKEVNFVGNYYKQGPSTTRLVFLNPQHESVGSGQQRYFMEGNILDYSDPTRTDVGPEDQTGGYTTDNDHPDAYVDQQFFPSHITEDSAVLAYKKVLSDVGCNLPMQDSHDDRVISNTLDRSFTYRGSKTNYAGLIDSQEDVGGWELYDELQRPAGWDTDGDGLPDWWETLIGTPTDSPAGDFSDAHADPDGDFWTNLDDYLAFLATPHYTCAVDGSVEIDLSQYTRGFTDAPVHAVVDQSQGSVEMLEDGVTARFTPVSGFSGLGSFRFTVTDGEGDSMEREIGIIVGVDQTWSEAYVPVEQPPVDQGA